MTLEYMLGNEAMARGLVEAGVEVVSGYPGTPSSEIIDTLRTQDHDFHVEWSVNEKAALEVGIGAAWSGRRSAITMKHVGMNVASDAFMTLPYCGVRAGLVIIVADDPGMHSSQNEQDTRRYAEFAKTVLLDPATPQEAKDMIPYAFELSEELRVPVILRPTTRISHAKSEIHLGEETRGSVEPGFVHDAKQWVVLPAHSRVNYSKLIEKQPKIQKKMEDNPWTQLQVNGNRGVIASGIASAYAEEAVETLGLSGEVSYLKVSSIPVPTEKIARLLEAVDEVIVVEELDPVVEERVRIIAQERDIDVRIMGKTSGHTPWDGEYNPAVAAESIANAFNLAYERGREETFEEIPPRPPIMCPGCPHRATFHSMKEAFGEDAVYPSDIGCYTLGTQMGMVEAVLCMGASVSLAAGMSHAGEEDVCCTVGDSTFLHTGVPGLMNAVYNNANFTLVILDNRTTAMTGHQPNPAMGMTATGEATAEVDLAGISRACGAEFVEVVDPLDIEKTTNTLKRARDYEGVSVIISKSPCVITARRQGIRRDPYQVTGDCVGCGVCVDFGCPAIEFAGEASINEQCSGCGACAQVCPTDAIMGVEE